MGERIGFYDRVEHYRRNYGMYDLPIHERPFVDRMAWEEAAGEMLDEIHSMLTDDAARKREEGDG